ncbi:hypothetical protein OROGR_023614 [Orobanche gracilis]
MSSSYAPCAACKYLRRKCTQECVFAPYFPPDNPQKFTNVHKVFGASNVGKILKELHPNQRNDAVNSLAYEAECRIKDPIYGCVGFVSILQHHLRQVQQEIERARKELATYIGPAAMQPILNNPAAHMQQQHNFDPSVFQTAPYHGQLVIQEPQQQQQQLVAREQELLRAYALQQQEQLYLQQLQQQHELYAEQQQRMQREMYVQQQQQHQQQNEFVRFNDAGDPNSGGFIQIQKVVAEAVQPELTLVGGGSFETASQSNYNNHYQVQQQQQQHHEEQLQIRDLLLQTQSHYHQYHLPHHHLNHHHHQQQQASHSQHHGKSDDERSFNGPL